MKSLMSNRSGHGDARKRKQNTSVVGSKVSDVSSRLSGRRLPRGGLREKDGLTVAEGALPDTTLIGRGGGRQRATGALRIIAIVSGLLLVLLILFGIVVALLSNTSMFSVRQVDTYDTEHLTAENIAKLAAIGDGTTLLNVDVSTIEQRLQKNPWVGSVDVVRQYPDTLRLEVHERTPVFYVVMGAGSAGWLMSEDGVWIEPLQIEEHSGKSASDAALKQAASMGLTLIYNVPASVSPKPGTSSTDACIASVMAFRNQLSAAFKDHIVSYSAASEDDIACILDSGIEISMGSPSNIDNKEKVAQSILDEYSGQVIYINVRVPSRPTYRRVNSKYVDAGSGATGTLGNSAIEGQSSGNSSGSTSGSGSSSSVTSNSGSTSGGGTSGGGTSNDATTSAGSSNTGTNDTSSSGSSGSPNGSESATTDGDSVDADGQTGHAESRSTEDEGAKESGSGGYVSPYNGSQTTSSSGESKVEGSSNSTGKTGNRTKT